MIPLRDEEEQGLTSIQTPQPELPLPTPSENHGNEIANTEEVMPEHFLSRSIVTVNELWNEWSEGLDGGPAIYRLEDKWGSRWRNATSTESSFFSRRNVIWNFIKEQAIQRLQLPQNIASCMESVRLSCGLSLQGLTLAIKGKNQKYTVESLIQKLDAECTADIQSQQILGSTRI